MKNWTALRALATVGLIGGLFVATAPKVYGAGAGYSQFYIPGDEDLLEYVLTDLRNEAAGTYDMHSIVAATAWAANTIVIVDHWEDGYEFDPQDALSTYDEYFTLAAAGDAKVFEDSNIPLGRTVNPDPTFCDASADEVDDSPCQVDGRDIIHIIGTSATITRGFWAEVGNTYQADAWEVYPVRPQLLKYILPFGENLCATCTTGNDGTNPGDTDLRDFDRVYALVQATADGTVLQIDFDNDGIYDSFDHNYDGTLDGTQLILDRGEVYLLDRRSDGPGGTLNTGTTILGSETLQVQYIVGDEGASFEMRAMSAFPQGFWDSEYYAPADETSGAGTATDIYIYNPHSSALAVDWETTGGSGSFNVPALSTVSFRERIGGQAPNNSAVYLRANDVFWGVSSIDAEGQDNDWGYSLVPRGLLDYEYFMGWAPSYSFAILPFNPANPEPDASGLFITAVQDNTVVYVDEDVDGVPDQTLNLNRLQVAYVNDSLGDHDLSRARVYATAPYAMAYGQNPDNVAGSYAPALDLGYTVLPTTDRWFDLVLDVEKSADPSLLAANTSGAITEFTIRAFTGAYSVDDLTIVDDLPAGFEYVAGFTTVTLPDGSTVTGGTADDGNTTGATDPAWSGNDVFGAYADLQANQAITIRFRARTTVATYNTGALAINNVTATGVRELQGNEQSFTASDFAFVNFSSASAAITKTSDVDPLAYPGDTINYTVSIVNDGAVPLTNVSLYDALPLGVQYVPGSGQVSRPTSVSNVRDQFDVAAYNNNNGSQNFASDWTEADSLGGGATGGLARIASGAALFAPASATNATVRDEFSAVAYTNNNGTQNWSGAWVESDTQGTTAGAGAGFVAVVSNALRLRYQTMNVRDDFTTSSYSRQDGSNNWSGDWTEIGDNGFPGSGTITVDAGNNNRVNFGQGNGTRTLTRSVNVASPSATISFTMTSLGVETGEGVVAEYSLDGGPFIVMQTVNGGSITGSGSVTVNTAAASTLTVRFRAFGNWTNANDNVGVDGVNVNFNEAVGAQILRSANLTGATQATLSFAFASAQLETNDTMVVEAATSAAGPFTVLETYNSATAVGTKTYDLTPYVSAATTVRFRVTGNLNATDEYFSFDNVQIAYTTGALTAANGAALTRTLASLVGAGAATLTFRFGSNALEAGDTMVVEVNSGAGFVTLASYDNTTSQGVKSLSLTGHLVAAPVLRFRVTGGVNDLSEYISIDDVDVSRWSTTVAAVPNSPPGFIAAGNAYSIPPGGTLTLTFQVTVDDPLATDIALLTNQACTTSTQLLLPLCAEVTDPVLNPSADAGEVGDLVWLDLDGDGIKDPGEPGLANVQVTLKDEFGTPIAVVLTDANGAYRFTGIAPGVDYFVEVTGGLPAGLVQTAPVGNSDNRSDLFDLGPGEIYLDADLGYRAPAGTGTIGDYVWQDSDQDGVQDPGELGLGGVTVLLYRDTNGDGILQPGAGSPPSIVYSGLPLAIPDNTPAGVSSTATVSGVPGPITGVTVSVNATHTWVGDLIFTLTSADGTVITLLDRPGAPPGSGCNNNNVVVTFADGEPNPEGVCTGGSGSSWPVALAAPVTALATLNGEDANGVWTLNVSDNAGADLGTLNSWELVIEWAATDDGPPIASTVTAADGSYHFFGVDATDGTGTDDYFVLVDGGQPALTGYTASTFAFTSVPNLGANEARLSNDFGFYPTSAPRYDFRDRVWFDPNEDEQDDGENGIAGVSVNLLDASRNVIATVMTDANGYFEFTGLSGGTFYYVEVSDTGGVLADFFGTTAEAVAGEIQLSNLTGDIDNTVEPTEPSFGYNAYGAVGDTVFNDLDGDGTQDPGEPGIAGVSVSLYTDADGDGDIEPGDTLVATVVTDSNGNYLFAGVPNGNYTVSIGTPPSGYNFTGIDSDVTSSTGHQLAATVTAGGADLDADFGYQAVTPRSISGTLWNDADNDGTLDDVGRFANVTIELRNASNVVIATTTTDASGNYTFAGLAAGSGYRVTVTDTNGVLNGYTTTYELSEGGLNSPYNGFETIDVTSGSATGVNFGYYRPPVVPLPVSLSSFHAERRGAGVRFTWTTDTEVGNIGFFLFGLVGEDWVDISADLIPSSAIDSTGRQSYVFESDDAGYEAFMLVDLDVRGEARYHGPFPVGTSRVSTPPVQKRVDWNAVRAEHAAKAAARQDHARAKSGASAVRVLVESSGLHRLTYEALAAAGFDWSGVPSSSLALFDRQGAVPIAVVPAVGAFGPGVAIEFFGEATNSLYNRFNHYTLRNDQDGAIVAEDGKLPFGTPTTTYRETTRIELDSKYSFGSPNGDPWYDTWVQAISGATTLSRPIVVEDLVPGEGPATLDLDLWGVTYWPAAPDHRVKARINGVELLDEVFDGHTTWQASVDFDADILDIGGNATLQLELPRDLPGVAYDIVAVDSYHLSYPRRLTTRSGSPGRFDFSHEGADAYLVDGFATDDLVVYRRGGGGSVSRLSGATVAWNGSSYQVSFPGSGPAEYFVAARSEMYQPGFAPVPDAVDLGAGPAKYLVISHPSFIAGVQPLVDYRTSQGYSADVVDVEAIYETYSNGMVDPEAIRAYIAEAVANRATGYVLLVGGDSYDYRDRLGYGSLSFVPTIYTATDELITHTPSDPLFGDLDGDGTAEIPVGRLPVRTDAELAAVIDKVIEFESKDYGRTLLAATDKYDINQGVSFKNLSDQMLQPLAATWTITHADVETIGIEAAKQAVKNALNQGQAYAQYFGHSSQTLWSFDRLFQVSDVPALTNSGRPSLVAQWGCWNNYFVDPAVTALGSALLTAEDRGAAAALGASTWTTTAGDLALGNYFLPLVTQPGRTVGDVLVASKRSLALAAPGQHLGVQRGWTLLGDPLLVLEPLGPGSCQGNPATGDGDGDGICDDIDVCVGSDMIGDIDGDGVCHDLDLCVGFPDSADADGDGVPDGCDLCLGDDGEGDPDGDGVCGAAPEEIFSDGFESGDTSEWSAG